MMSTRRRLARLALAAAISGLAASAALAGYWQREPAQFHPPLGEQCPQLGTQCSAGWQRYDPGSKFSLRVYEADETQIILGKQHPQVQPGWSRIRGWWQAPPAALLPGQKISFDLGIAVQASGWANLDTAVWIYRMGGPGGPDEQLGRVQAKDSSGGSAGKTRLHTVPDGKGLQNTPARLRYQMGVSDFGKVVFSYRWIENGSPPVSATPAPGPTVGAATGQTTTGQTATAGANPTSRPPVAGPTGPSALSPGTLTNPAAGGSPANATGPVVNLALSRPATQSSIYLGTGVNQGPHHAVDGITAGRDPHDLIHTNFETRPWWRVHLGASADVSEIRLHNRTNPGVKSNLALEVMISDDGQNWRRVYTHDKSVWTVLTLPVNARAAWVQVQLADYAALHLYEVEVFGRR